MLYKQIQKKEPPQNLFFIVWVDVQMGQQWAEWRFEFKILKVVSNLKSYTSLIDSFLIAFFCNYKHKMGSLENGGKIFFGENVF